MPLWQLAIIKQDKKMTKIRKADDEQAKVLQNIVKSLLFDAEDWPSSQEVSVSMTRVFESMGYLETPDVAEFDGHKTAIASPIGAANNIVFLLSIAGLHIYDGVFLDLLDNSGISAIDDQILTNCLGTPRFWHHLRHIAMHLYYDHYDIDLGSDEDPIDTSCCLMAANM
jgi:hypothetical protein